MIRFLADHDVEGQARILWGVLAARGWLGLLDLELLSFRDVGLGIEASDRQIWRFAQERGLILLTNNRNMDHEDSLERTLRDESSPSSLPVLTIGSVPRLVETKYRERCALRVVEIAVDVESYRGSGRIYIP